MTISLRAAKYLWDIERAADRIIRFAANRSFDEYLADEMFSAAVERQFEIIGEALVRLRRSAPEIAAQIPDIQQIIGFRNVLVHAYDDIDATAVWGTIRNDVPHLHAAVTELLRDAPNE